MVRGIGCLVFLCWLQPGGAQERTIQLPEVSVRTGPAHYCEPTDLLHQGDKVQVRQVRNGFAEITPPPGAFNLIPHSAVMQVSQTEVIVKQPYAETIIGSNLTLLANRPGVKLQRGAKLHVLDSVFMVHQGRPQPYFKIAPPPGEVRYVALEAFQSPRASTIPPGDMTAFYPPDPQTTLLLREADDAYQRGLRSGNWEEARRKYLELAQSSNHHARMTALNRLEFIRTAVVNPQQPLGGQSGMPAGTDAAARLQNRDWHLATNKPAAPGAPSGPDRLPPTPTPPANPFPSAGNQGSSPLKEPTRPLFNPTPGPRPAMTTGNTRPVTPAKEIGQPQGQRIENHFPSPSSPGTQPQVGILAQAFQSTLGQPLFYLTDRNGSLVCFLTPRPGLDLRPFVAGATPVEVKGGPMNYRADLRGNHMRVDQVRLLGNVPAR